MAALLNVPELSLALPVVFCYAFFDSLNIRSYTFEEAQAKPDNFLFFEPWFSEPAARQIPRRGFSGS